MLKYGPTINTVIIELIIAPKMNIALGLKPKTEVEMPNAVNIIPMIAATTVEITKVMIITPRKVTMHSNHPISSMTSFISLIANAFENAPSLYAI